MDTASLVTESLLKNTYTRAHILYRLEVFKEFLEKVFFTHAQVRGVTADGKEASNEKLLLTFLKGRGENEHTVASLQAIPMLVYQTITAQTVYSIIDMVKERTKNLPTFIVYVPVEFDEKETQRIGTWIRAHIQKDLLISFRISPKSAGGCAFIWRDAYYDFSFSYFFKAHKTAMIRSIRDAYERFRNTTKHTG